jgi:hypothetical protein
MSETINILLCAVHDFPVLVSDLRQNFVKRAFVGHNRAASRDVFFNDGHHRPTGTVSHSLCDNATATLNHANDWNFVFQFGGHTTGTANISFIHFNDAGKSTAILLHELADLMSHAPSALVSHANMPFNFLSRNAVLCGGHEKDGMEPRFERSGRLVEDGASRGADMMPTSARIGPAFGDWGKGVLTVALGANNAVRVPLREYVGQASGIRGELGVEVLDSVAHTHTITHIYLLSRDNYLIKRTINIMSNLCFPRGMQVN